MSTRNFVIFRWAQASWVLQGIRAILWVLCHPNIWEKRERYEIHCGDNTCEDDHG